jgi:hypothetical protein
MPRCPKCKTEYRNGYVRCIDCNMDLIDQLPLAAETDKLVEADNDEVNNTFNSDQEAFLISVPDDNQAILVESLLKAYQIPVLKRFTGLGHYFQLYWGFTVFGVDLYVPSQFLIAAKEILENRFEEQDTEIGSGNTELNEVQLQQNNQNDKTIRNWLVIISYFGFGFIAIFYWLYKKISNIKH